ncbi:MAG: hypothetical protein K2X87_16910 [Gemmataceae bacterium]|nr:hypothetical protein [Gemmataceae bacterium]
MATALYTPATARGLLAAVRPFGPAAEGDELVFAAGPPAELLPALAVGGRSPTCWPSTGSTSGTRAGPGRKPGRRPGGVKSCSQA